jgi:peptidoglycan/xylan/chitin deacetylase (PgdA/CDA1 family)
MVTVLTAVCFLFLLSPYFDLRPAKHKKIIVAFRNDDIQRYVPTHAQQGLFNLFKENGIKQTYAIVPFETDFTRNNELMDYLQALLKQGLAEIALHGYAHANLGTTTLKTEFLGQPLQAQTRKISEGKEYLEKVFGQKIITFIPPFNSYDLNTVQALKKNNIQVLGSSVYYHYPYQEDMTIINPNQLLIDPTVRDIQLAEHYGPELSIFIFYYHSYMADIYRSDDYYGQIQKLIDYIKGNHIEVMALGELGLKYPGYFKERYDADIWRGRADVFLEVFQQRSLLRKLGDLSACGYIALLRIFSIVVVGWGYGLFLFTGIVSGLVLSLITQKRWFLIFMSAGAAVLWLAIVTVFSDDARLGMMDFGLLACAGSFVISNVMTIIATSR